MQFATGALGSLLPKLTQLLYGEYKLQKGVRKNIEFLKKELEHTEAALHTIGEMPQEQLSKQVKLWTRDARELSYHMEDIIDTFLVRVEGPDPPSKRSSRKFIRKMKSLLTVAKRHQIGEQINDIKERVMELAARRDRCKVDTISPVTTNLDPPITSLYRKEIDLVGISEAKQELLMNLQQQRIVSIVGTGGLGKTTLAKVVYDEIKLQFNCTAFVTVSRTPDMKKILKDILFELDQGVYGDIHNRFLDETQLIYIARQFLHDKRYLIIIDDIWNTSHWDLVIKHALPDDNSECKIITTTRKVNVANHIGCAYEMQSLSLDSSRSLLCTRIFGNEDPTKCLLHEQLADVSNRILKKCAGVPLAIITIASLLVTRGRNKTEWDEVCNSIGTGMENSLDVDNMRNILSYSYYDLPSHLQTCLLYLSIFPEDFEIPKDRLIWLWIAEDFIQPGKQWKKSQFELGETYFNELINRSLIQPVVIYLFDNIDHCRIHDMVLDLIHSLSTEENFVTIVSNMDQTPPSTVVRRLSIQHGKACYAKLQITQSLPLLRSVVIFPSALDQMLTFRSFKVLRVLDLEGCNLSHVHCLEYLGSLFHLRYLNLDNTKIDGIPEAVGSLQFLEILSIQNHRIRDLPFCVDHLTHLLCLSVSWSTKLSKWIGCLTSLTELKHVSVNDESLDAIHGLGLLTELRVLHIDVDTDKWTDKVVESLCQLQKIQILYMVGSLNEQCKLTGLDAWVLTPQLRCFCVQRGFWFSTLPAWLINPLVFQDLYRLNIFIRELRQRDLEILGRLPALKGLWLGVDHEDLGIFGRRFVVGASLFPCLERCIFMGCPEPLMFLQGAMPNVWELYFDLHVREVREINGGFDCGLHNLQSLKILEVNIVQGDASEMEVQKVKDTLEHAAEIHPGQPKLYFRL